MHRIHKLPLNIANQIAAGEVIQRPASVVKELLENSLDAKANKITLIVNGIYNISICDNGIGIHPDDLALAVNRYTTSKISKFDDIQNIQSFGFRGEALASIVSVSHFSISSCIQNDGYIWDNISQQIKLCAQPKGTRVNVDNLFYNTPARKKFLATDKTEIQHIEAWLKRLALANFNTAFNYYFKDKLSLRLVAANNEIQQQNRIAKICGKKFIDNAIYFDKIDDNIRLYGWIANPNWQRNSNDLNFFYLNGRFVKDQLLHRAIKIAFVDVLYDGKQPAYVLYLQINPKNFDINIHPTKQEVRFYQARMIHDFIVSAIKKKLNLNKSFEYKDNITLDDNDEIQEKSQDNNYLVKTNNIFWLESPYLIYKNQDDCYLVNIVNLSIKYAEYKMLTDLAKNHKISSIKLSAPVKTDKTDILANLDIDLLSKLGLNYTRKDKQIWITAIPKYLEFIDIKNILINLPAHQNQIIKYWCQQNIPSDNVCMVENWNQVLEEAILQQNSFVNEIIKLDRQKLANFFLA